jgi:hypothetical protein
MIGLRAVEARDEVTSSPSRGLYRWSVAFYEALGFVLKFGVPPRKCLRPAERRRPV